MQELGNQIIQELSTLVEKTSIKYKNINDLDEAEKEKIQQNKSPGFNILVTTPLSFINIFEEHSKILKSVKFLILDECDKYF